MCADFGRCSESGLGAAPNPPSVSAERPARAPPCHTKARPHPSRPRGRRGDPFPGVRGGFSCPPTVQGACDCFPQPKHTIHALFRWRPLGWSWCERPSLQSEGSAPPFPAGTQTRQRLAGWGRAWRAGAWIAASPAEPRAAPCAPLPGAGRSPLRVQPRRPVSTQCPELPQLPTVVLRPQVGKGSENGGWGRSGSALCTPPPPRGFCCRRASANSSPSSVLLLLFQIIIV